MKVRASIACAALAAAALLGACGERPQTAQAPQTRGDTPAWQGASNPYVASGWKPGDAASWEQHMRRRAQGQNEYSRAN
ncbi:hypothetical protein [Schlegelella aquatica]|uniref:hypothetical protein n=1 Tax=Caldimonas aquatica TaxID=376175 RepID=UPI0037525FF2